MSRHNSISTQFVDVGRSGGSVAVPFVGQDRPAKPGQRGDSRALDPERLILRGRVQGEKTAAQKRKDKERQDQRRRTKRVGFGKLKKTASELAGRKSLLWCGINGADDVALQISPKDLASYGGARVCKCAWLCPDCAGYLARTRMAIVRARLEGLKEEHGGGHFFLMTLTLRRVEGVPLKEVMAGLQQAHNATTSGAAWQKLKAELGGAFHYVRGREVVLSHFLAWGPHDHWCVFIPGNGPLADKMRVFRRIVARFIRFARKAGFHASRAGQDIQVAEDPERAAEYATKGAASSRWTVVEEAGGGGLKNRTRVSEFEKTMAQLRQEAKAEKRGISIWQLLAAAHGGDADARELVKEYAAGTRRQRVVATSRTIKLSPDEDLPDPEQEQPAQVVCAILPNKTMRHLGHVGAAELLNASELAWLQGGLEGVHAMLSERLRDMPWSLPPDQQDHEDLTDLFEIENTDKE